MSEAQNSRSLTRRTFLKTTAAVVGAATVGTSIGCVSGGTEDTGGIALVEDNTSTFANLCRGNCGAAGGCCLETKVREGKIISTRLRPVKGKDINIQPGCIKGPANPQRIYGAHRLLYPMLQTGERGSDNWERITWDEAISMIAEKMQTAFDEYGPESVAFMSSYSGMSGQLGNMFTGYVALPGGRSKGGIGPERFFQKTGASIFLATGDNAGLYMLNVALAGVTNSIEDTANAKNIIMLSNACDSWRTVWSSILDSKEKGSKLIVIDPRFSNSAAHADQWIPVRPGTDGALFLGMSNYIIDNDLIDYDYLRNKSVAPLLIKEDSTYLRLSDMGLPLYKKKDSATGEETEVDTEVVYDGSTFGSSFEIKDPLITGSFDANGVRVKPVMDLVRETIKPFTVEFAAKECGLPAETIEGLARTYADGPSFIVTHWGWQHFQNSWRNYYGLLLLASLTGNSCKPGASYGNSLGGSSLFKTTALNSQAALTVEGAKNNRTASLNKLPEIVESGKWQGEDYTLRLLWVAGSNAIGSGIGYKPQIEAWKKIDFVVVACEFMTDTTRQASLALPVAMSFEAEDFAPSSIRFLNQKAIEPIGESKTDFEIFVDLAKAMGYTDLYDKDATGYLRELLDTEENIAAGVGYDDYHEKGVIYKDEIVRIENVAAERNATGRTQFYLESLTPNGNFDVEVSILDCQPYYEHAYEGYADNPLREKYPLFGISYHDNYTGQTMHSNVAWLNEIRGLDGKGEPYTIIHETAAAERGIVTGDEIRVFNERGGFVCRALVSKGIREDTVNIPRGYEGHELKEGHLQSLTSIDAKDRITNNDSHNDWLCQVEKV